MHVQVKSECTVYEGMCPINGSDPLWCSNSCCIGRIGDRLFATGQELVPDARPLNNTRWVLYEMVDNSWRRLQADAKHLTREPCPMGVLQSGRVLLSVNPDISGELGARPDETQPRVLELEAASPRKRCVNHVPTWPERPLFTHHSYRAFAVDRNAEEAVLFQNVGYTHSAWALLTNRRNWITGALTWPEYPDCSFEPYDTGSTRVNYMTAALHGREVHVCGASAHNKWDRVRDNPDLMGRQWGNRFRRLYYTWTPAIDQRPFVPWTLIDHTEDTGGWLFAGDLHVDSAGVVHLLYSKLPIERELRRLHFPDIERVYSLEYVQLKRGALVCRRTLAKGGENAGDVVPFNLAGEELVYRWRKQPIRVSRVPTPRFHAMPDGTLCVLYYATDTETRGGRISENKLMRLGKQGQVLEAIGLHLQWPLVQFYTASPRAGSEPATTIDMLGYRTDGLGLYEERPTQVSYACVELTANGT